MKPDDITLENDFFGTDKIISILLKIAPPVMLAQLIQALYNIVDSFFVGRYSSNALTALSVIYPLQLIIVALAVGTGVGLNTYMARKYAQHDPKAADNAAGTCIVLALGTWAVFAAVSALIMEPYVRTSATSPEAIADAVVYGRIVCIGSLGVFLEGCWYGFGLWWIMYLYVWPLLAGITYLLRRQRSVWVFSILSGAFGLMFGALCSLVYLFVGGPAAAFTWWVAGIPYDLIHGVSNFILCSILFYPLRGVLEKISN